jgi:hypothetical protein
MVNNKRAVFVGPFCLMTSGCSREDIKNWQQHHLIGRFLLCLLLPIQVAQVAALACAIKMHMTEEDGGGHRHVSLRRKSQTALCQP